MTRVIIISFCIIFLKCSITYGISDEYVVNSAKCKIPNLDPFSDEVTPISIPENYTSCTNLTLLSYVSKTDNFAELRLRPELFHLYSDGEIECCYASVKRDGSSQLLPDVGIRYSTCQPFNLSAPLFDLPVLVLCRNENYSIVYENVHSPITIREDIRPKLEILKNKKALSVLFVIIDSVSRLNLMRTMKNTRDYLLENSFIELKGYNKVADNTFPNCMAFLTGFNLSMANTVCNPKMVGKLDQCPMIWYDFRDLGYVTAYAEDEASISTFNYLKKGFTNPPTDYYFKPYIEASEFLKIRYKDYMAYCTGPETSGERILNLAKDFAVTFKNHSSFGVFWMNTFSHNKMNTPYGMDEKVKSFFVDLKNQGVLNESLVIFLSDHGIRFDPIRLTRSGWFEERLPFHLISVPKWFQDLHPDEYRNLQNNANKLTSTYDLYMTLQHILQLSGLNYTTKPSKACEKCHSLFKEIPQDRSCEDAGIPAYWCTCIGHLEPTKPDEPLIQEALNYTLKKIKNLLDAKVPDLCADYSVNQVNASISETMYDGSRYIFATFLTQPPARFLLSIKFKDAIDESSTVQLIRYDSHSESSQCVLGTSLQSYCYCKDMVIWNFLKLK